MKFSKVFFFVVSFLVFMCSFWLCCRYDWLLEGFMFFGGLKDFCFEFMVDFVSISCGVMLVFCGLVSLVYCGHYSGWSRDCFFLGWLMFCFLLVMFSLVFCSNLLITLVFWEYLGLVSFYLILFYSNSGSFRACLITLCVSRVGDVALFFIVCWSGVCSIDSSFFFSVLVVLVVLTKSASYPFLPWLLEAMCAPTPVSCLVHSSTLVAAGVWFMMRYPDLLGISGVFLSLLFSLYTILISGVCGVVYTDLKKIVALSTGNNISWCIVFFIYGDPFLVGLQLLSHGVNKCLLFVLIGAVLSDSGGNQNSSLVRSFRHGGVYGVLLQFVLLISLCGMPFVGVFFCKHAFLASFVYLFGGFVGALVLFCVFLTCAYCCRLFLLVSGCLSGFSSCYGSKFVLLISVVGVPVGLGLLSHDLFLSASFLSHQGSILTLAAQVMGFFFGWFSWYFSLSGSWVVWCSLLCGGELVVWAYFSFFSSAVNLFLLGLYRWEVLLVSSFVGFCSSVMRRWVLWLFFLSLGSFVFSVFLFSFFFISVF